MSRYRFSSSRCTSQFASLIFALYIYYYYNCFNNVIAKLEHELISAALQLAALPPPSGQHFLSIVTEWFHSAKQSEPPNLEHAVVPREWNDADVPTSPSNSSDGTTSTTFGLPSGPRYTKCFEKPSFLVEIRLRFNNVSKAEMVTLYYYSMRYLP